MIQSARFIPLIFGLHGGLPVAVQGQAAAGQDAFQAACSACHTIGGGRLVGPDLRGLTQRRTEEWIIRFVQHPMATISAGDSAAGALYQEYGMAMPDQALSPDQVREIVAYIAGPAASSSGSAALPAATEEQVRRGKELFQGTVRFANAGPACISCHTVTNDSVAVGGALARDLTDGHSRLGPAGIGAILGAAPFPVMAQAYRDRPLNPEEIVSLVGFLRRMDEQRAAFPAQSAGARLVVAGIWGVLILFALYSWAWRRRSRQSVNQALYDRQVTSI